LVFHIIPLRPNPREKYQRQVKKLCKLLSDKEGTQYRFQIFGLLNITGNQATKNFNRGYSLFRDLPEVKRFSKYYFADLRVIAIMDELDKIYAAPSSEIDHLRGAIGEVFSYYICCKVYSKADIEVQVRIGSWTSESIDTAGCNEGRGHCIQSKCGGQLGDIDKQKQDLDKIEKLTRGIAKGLFVTFGTRQTFHNRLRFKGIDTQGYRILDRSDLGVLESILKS
jgi:hypothetical protein